MQHTIYIGIGSNVGDRLKNCEAAVESLRQREDVQVTAVSKWRETKAVTADGKPGPPYINGAVKILTRLKPRELLQALKNIEKEMGRPEEHAKWSPRVIDLDILFYDDLVISEKDLVIPHPEIPKRIFVLEALCDIDPTICLK